MRLVAVDIGGTHARFAMAEVTGGKVVALGEAVTLKTAEHASFQLAWQEFERISGGALPPAAAIAVAGPVGGDIIRFTNNPWIIRPTLIPEKLGAERYVVVNDFAAVAHSVAQADDAHFLHVCGPETALPDEGAISVVGPGTGLGVAVLLRHAHGYHVQPTEGGHIDYAPLDRIEDQILARLRKRHRRVSVERVVAGPGIVDIYETLASIEDRAIPHRDDKAIWAAGMDGSDPLAAAAVDRFCLSLGSVAGDLALAHGSKALVLAGGLGFRIRDNLVASGFADRFRAKGRFDAMMAAMPVKLITHPQPGLFGAAAAFAQSYRD
ncbi:glucokinase [Novosphingobium sp. FSW06-99]|uniref:glucokinase n=1 Tax=Novosphingobium sp. FSW06-99 TaxID=1739113 RepID=UPI00076C585F|nr:glucokinase [Novosphingobium sp. FSW06-99]KUR80686.1 glucokinase [Novosphingobium sp. FSW06-99]